MAKPSKWLHGSSLANAAQVAGMFITSGLAAVPFGLLLWSGQHYRLGILLFALGGMFIAVGIIWFVFAGIILAKIPDREARPKLVVVPRNTRDNFCLEVTNHGEQGELEAQITILSGDGNIHGTVWPPKPYVGYWETAVGDKPLLKEGLADRLLIGRTEYEWPLALVSLKMFFFDRKAKALSSFGTVSWIVMGADKAAPGTVFALRVAISTTPRMADGPFIRDYSVRIGEQEALVELQTDSATSS